jgi:hypothetical protein
MDRVTAGSVLRDALDRANEDFRCSTVDLQKVLQISSKGCARQFGLRAHAKSANALLNALDRFEHFVAGGPVPADLEWKAGGIEAAKSF